VLFYCGAGSTLGSDVARDKASGGSKYAERKYKVEKVYDLFEDCEEFTSIAIHGKGKSQRVAVLDSETLRVLIVNAESGKRVATAGSCGAFLGFYGLDDGTSLGHGQLDRPREVAFSPAGELYVSDMGLHRIQVFDRQGRYVRGFGERGEGEGQFNGPHGLCFTADGELVVADFFNHRVQVLQKDGTFVRAFGSRGQGDGEFGHNFVIDCGGPDGSIAVLDRRDGRIQIFDREGVFVRTIGSKGEGPGQLLSPFTLAVGAGGEIIVGDSDQKGVKVFSKEGELLQIIGPGGDSDVDLTKITQVCTDASGRLFVLDSNHVKMLC
jgi:DNA-binding beta-propeller fold protein YncE